MPRKAKATEIAVSKETGLPVELFRSNDEALIDELGGAGEKPICSKSFTSTIRRRGFFRSFAEAADFSDTLLNFLIFAAQISVRQSCHCRNAVRAALHSEWSNGQTEGQINLSFAKTSSAFSFNRLGKPDITC
jgi:hypothetical protein